MPNKNKMPKSFPVKQLKKILQRLKSLLLKDLDPEQRSLIKSQLEELDENYTNNKISFEEYKLNSVTLLCNFRNPHWVEQFLYRETGNFFTQQEKFLIVEKIPLSN
jgi:hypothetical protein